MSQLSFMFKEDEPLFGTPEDILKCLGTHFALDCETTGLSWWKDKIIGISIVCPDKAISKYIVTTDPLIREECFKHIAVLSQDPASVVAMHNAKFDLGFIHVDQWQARWKVVDTMVMAHLVDSRMGKSLKVVEQIFLGTTTKFERLAGISKAHLTDIPAGVLAEYSINDARVTYEIAKVLSIKIKSLGLSNLFNRQMEYLGAIQHAEKIGILLDLQFLDDSEKILNDALLLDEYDLLERTAIKFNWRSPIQLSAVLYPGITGRSTDVKEIEGHPLAGLIGRMREIDKLIAVINNWKELADGQNVLHCNFNLTGTRTGRLSSSKPNLQNITAPIRRRAEKDSAIRDEAYNLRNGLRARPGNVFVGFDYSQQELRLFGILSQDAKMLTALRSGTDLHEFIARLVWGEDLKKDPSLLKLRRTWSKNLSFGLIYGIGKDALAKQLNVSPDKAKQILSSYLAAFPRIRPFMESVAGQCQRDGYVRLWSGRLWRESDPNAMYKAVNALVQGGAADLLMEAAIRGHQFAEQTHSGHLVSFIHDELLYEIKEDRVQEILFDFMRLHELEDIFKMPFLVTTKIGLSYGSLKEVDITVLKRG